MAVKYTQLNNNIQAQVSKLMFNVADAVAKNTEAVIKKGFLDFPKPPIKTGNLRRNIVGKVISVSDDEVVAEVRASTPLLTGLPSSRGKTGKKGSRGGSRGGKIVEYAKFIEFGTVKMQARPFMRNGIAKAEKTNQLIVNRLAKAASQP